MKVTIENSEKTEGLFKKKTWHIVTTTVVFSEEEKAIIKERKLGDTIVITRDLPADRDRERWEESKYLFDMTIDKLLKKSDEYVLSNRIDAKNYDGEVREAMKTLKGYITDSAEPAEASSSFEL